MQEMYGKVWQVNKLIKSHVGEVRKEIMRNNETLTLAVSLLKADSEEEVISILKKVGYWDDPKAWRLIGDREGNYSTIGNQQSRPDAALTEKVINAIDARLMNECLVAGIDPKSPQAPKSIRDAVRRFFDGKETYGGIGGTVQEWDTKRRREVSEGITVAVTGDKRKPCVTICDIGEGQTSNVMPDTFLSIDRQNKLSIFFVQGRFNMGGTGVLEFCGMHNLHLIVTKRNPNIVKAMNENDESSEYWGFTIIRIQSPPQKIKNSIYTYLAPLNAERNPCRGDVLRFSAESLPLMPQGNEPYVRDIEWGSAVKMYNYDMKGFSSHVCMKDGLLYRLEAMLPEPAIPIRIYECRSYRGHSGSFATTLSGLIVRLDDNKADNLEEGFPDAVPFKVNGEKMDARIYAFKKGKAETYRTNEGIIFAVNGQTHGAIPKTFFSRQNVKMGRLSDSLLIIIDCSSISYRAREKLFMNSRDRIRNNELRKALEEQLEDIICRHPGLRELKDRRKSQEIAELLDNSKPLEEVLESILRSSPSLSALFLTGNRLSKPHKQQPVGGGHNGTEPGDGEGDSTFQGKIHPTFFKFKDRKYGELLQRNCETSRNCRIAFETDVVNDYFKRATNPGQFMLEVLEGGWSEDDINWSLTLHNGIAHASVSIPENATSGDIITLQFVVKDDVIMEPLVNVAKLYVKPKLERHGGTRGKTKQRNGGNGQNLQPSGIQLPKFWKVHEEEWEQYGFDRYSACKIIQDDNEQNPDQDVYDFYINVDNIFLRTDMKSDNEAPRLSEAKFIYGNILIGLGLIKDYREQEKKAKENNYNESNQIWHEDFSAEEYVSQTTKALAPFILPMINNLGSLSEDDVSAEGQIGDDE